MNELRNCTICNIESSDNFCANCGQSISKRKTTVISLISEFITNILDLEKSVFGSILVLFRNPKKIIENYWNGYRKYYPTPGKFLIYALAIIALHLTYVNGQIFGMNLSMNDGQVDAQIIFFLFFLPFLALSSYLCYISRFRGITKHLVSLLYLVSCFSIVLTVLNDLLSLILGDTFEFYMLGIFFLLVFISNARVFSKRAKFYMIILNAFLQFLIFIGLLATFAVIVYFLNPDQAVIN